MTIVKSLLSGLCLSVLVIPTDALAHEALLLRAKETRTAADVIASDLWAERSAYFGKRSRLASLNASVLLADEPFDIEVFDGVTITIKKTEIRQNIPNSWIWVGQQIEPRMPVWLPNGRELSPEQQRALEDDVHRVQFLIIRTDPGQKSVDESPAPVAPAEPLETFGAVSPAAEASQPRQQTLDPAGTYVIKGLISTPGINHQYKLEPVDSSPSSVLVVEIDPDKSFLVPESDNAEESDENRERRLRYESFVREQMKSRGGLNGE